MGSLSLFSAAFCAGWSALGEKQPLPSEKGLVFSGFASLVCQSEVSNADRIQVQFSPKSLSNQGILAEIRLISLTNFVASLSSTPSNSFFNVSFGSKTNTASFKPLQENNSLELVLLKPKGVSLTLNGVARNFDLPCNGSFQFIVSVGKPMTLGRVEITRDNTVLLNETFRTNQVSFQTLQGLFKGSRIDLENGKGLLGL